MMPRIRCKSLPALVTLLAVAAPICIPAGALAQNPEVEIDAPDVRPVLSGRIEPPEKFKIPASIRTMHFPRPHGAASPLEPLFCGADPAKIDLRRGVQTVGIWGIIRNPSDEEHDYFVRFSGTGVSVIENDDGRGPVTGADSKLRTVDPRENMDVQLTGCEQPSSPCTVEPAPTMHLFRYKLDVADVNSVGLKCEVRDERGNLLESFAGKYPVGREP